MGQIKAGDIVILKHEEKNLQPIVMTVGAQASGSKHYVHYFVGQELKREVIDTRALIKYDQDE